MLRQRGFTLIELLLAVAIISMLTAVAISGTGVAIRHSQEAVTKGNLGILRATLATYYADHEGQYPTDSTLASITSGNGYLQAVPTKYTPPYHPPGNDIDGGNWSDMVAARAAWFYISDANSPSWGTIVVNCVHQDTHGQTWSSY